MIDAAGLLRAASALTESGASLSRLAPTIGTDYAKAAAVLRVIAAGLHAMPLLAAATPPARAAKPTAAKAFTPEQKRAASARASAWTLDRLSAWPADKPPPSAAEDWEAAKMAIPGVPRAIVRRFRPVEWQLRRGERPRSPKT